jgi:hypothetical protein
MVLVGLGRRGAPCVYSAVVQSCPLDNGLSTLRKRLMFHPSSPSCLLGRWGKTFPAITSPKAKHRARAAIGATKFIN